MNLSLNKKKHNRMDIRSLTETILDNLERINYDEYISRLTVLEKRKLLALLILLFTNINMVELTNLTIQDFKKLCIGSEKVPMGCKNLIFDDRGAKYIKPGLYDRIMNSRPKESTILASIINNTPLSSINVRRDMNEQIVMILSYSADQVD